MKLIKSWTPEIFMECYCVVRNKPIRCEITKLQTATVISLWFWGLLACPELYCDWPVHNQHSWNFSGVQGVLSMTVMQKGIDSISNCVAWKKNLEWIAHVIVTRFECASTFWGWSGQALRAMKPILPQITKTVKIYLSANTATLLKRIISRE